jgi:hypothetical protein
MDLIDREIMLVKRIADDFIEEKRIFVKNLLNFLGRKVPQAPRE